MYVFRQFVYPDFSFSLITASLGGILGLCVGGSFVSLVEIIYFFIINGFFKKKPKEVPLKSKKTEIHIQSNEHPKNRISCNISTTDDLYKSELNMKKNFFVERKVSPVKMSKTNEILHYFSNDQ